MSPRKAPEPPAQSPLNRSFKFGEDKEVQQNKYQSQNIHHDDDLKSPAKVKRQSKFIPKQPNDLTGFGDPDDSDAEPEYVDIDNTQFSPLESYEEMRGWIKALMTATIDIDDSVPVVSSCSTPTVSLLKAQELLAKAREETKLKDEELRAKGFIRDGFDDDYSGVIDSSGNYNNFFGNSTVDNQNTSNGNTSTNNNNESLVTSEENSPIVDSLDETTMSSVQRQSTDKQPKLSIDTSVKGYKSPSTPQVSNGQNNSNNNGASHSGFASPYLLASGLLSPKLGHSFPPSSPIGTPNSRERKQPDYFNQAETASTTAQTISSGNSNTANSQNGPSSSGTDSLAILIRVC
ncbi:hypothetical protein QCA50_012722 [Cerrena zonata]|uniref:Uncharacterized protein n=1 Tax=Cerrena zonata TaxID=2478898 RepID=A0AAW0FYZ7_9APHY